MVGLWAERFLQYTYMCPFGFISHAKVRGGDISTWVAQKACRTLCWMIRMPIPDSHFRELA